MFKVILACYGVPPQHALEAAAEISAEFAEHRQWHKHVRCSWDGTRLMLVAENDYDSNGEATLDEFSDCVAAYVPGTFGYRVSLVAIDSCTSEVVPVAFDPMTPEE